MVNTDDGKAPESRPPTLSDLLTLCRALNNASAKYIVVGGMAIIEAGFVRATEDIDLLIEVSVENQKRVRSALMKLPDQAVQEMRDDDIEQYMVVRVADEIVIDLMKRACGVEYNEAKQFINIVEIEGVKIPFASPELLWKTKQTLREKDKLDLLFLKELLSKKG
jgi:hypothetical protein